MSEILTIAEIEQRYAPDWVLINNPQTDEQHNLLGGEVISVSPDRDKLYLEATALDLKYAAVHYLGPWPEDMIFIL